MQPALPIRANRRRTCSGSKCHAASSSAAKKIPVMATVSRNCGRACRRNAVVSRSMIIRSTKSTVSQSFSCLNCESRIKVPSKASEQIAAGIGRRHRTAAARLIPAHTSRNAVLDTSPTSVSVMRTRAVPCKAASRPSAHRTRKVVPPNRPDKAERVGGILNPGPCDDNSI